MGKIMDHRRVERSFFIAIVACLLFSSAFAQRKERLVDSWQPTHFDVAITFDGTLSQIASATTAIDVRARKGDVGVIDLDFGTMPVAGVTVDGRAVKFAQHDEKLDVFLPTPTRLNQTLRVSVNYSGIPKDGLILSKDKDGFPSAIGDNWADRVHHWIPCLDHPSAKASVTFTVTAPSDYQAVANGAQLSMKVNPDRTKTWVFNETRPVSPYNMVVAVGRFATGTLRSASTFPITYYVPQSEGRYAERGFAPAAPSVVTFSNLVGPYPYKKLALIVGATRFGGMENANTIVFSPNYFKNFENSAAAKSKLFGIPNSAVEVDAHEIAHQWFGDSVTESTWSDLWLSEGFATYFAGLFLERNEGPERFKEYMRKNAQGYLAYEKTRRAPIHDTQTEKLFDLLNPNNYEKGGWVLHMLRGMLGDKVFFAGLRSYYDRHKDGLASTEDLRRDMENVSGRDLKNFFDRWIYKAGHPVYQVKWRSMGKGMIGLTLLQAQADEAFLQPVTVEIRTKAGKRRVIVRPDSKETTVAVKSANPGSIVIDPDEAILKEVVN
ncbi:MAG TPA: M1 family metallopeptidase [Pyrinomonadaceae bacterium]|nr:M1 family metallopeptidase [Pyrinomonadaceae bacterium]